MTAFAIGLAAVLALAMLALVRTIAAMRWRASANFIEASERFYKSAEELLSTDDELPYEALRLISGSSAVLASRRRLIGLARDLARPRDHQEITTFGWNSEVASQMTDKQLELLVNALVAMVEAAIHVSLRYQSDAIKAIFYADDSEPMVPARTAKAKLGASLISSWQKVPAN